MEIKIMLKKVKSLLILTSIALFYTAPVQADNDANDWKSLPATACQTNNDGITYLSRGTVSATKGSFVRCPMVRDNIQRRPARFRVSASSTNGVPCRVFVLNRTGSTASSFPLNVPAGNNQVRVISFHTTYNTGHLAVRCSLQRFERLHAYSLSEL